jgi:hypothetical protein
LTVGKGIPGAPRDALVGDLSPADGRACAAPRRAALVNQNGAHTELPFAILNPKLASRMILASGFILVMAWMLAAAPE